MTEAQKNPKDLQSWGRYPKHSPKRIITPAWRVFELPVFQDEKMLGYGKGRSYGDSCQNTAGIIIDSSRLNRFIGFDEATGLLCCEAGVTLDEILDEFAPRGWFLSVTPGTKFVTVAGAIANDVHGKNHHCEGTFGRHITRFGLMRSDGMMMECSKYENEGLYKATIGGMGLTGFITWAEIRLKRIENQFISMESRRFDSLEEFFELSSRADAEFPYTASWTDCASPRKFGRGILTAGRHAEADERNKKIPDSGSITFPFDAPSWLLNRFSILGFNAFYYRTHFAKVNRKIVHYNPFFYPLDAILHWNRMYGKRGFLQYQFHVPVSLGREVIGDIFRRIACSGEGSFLAVLKTFGSIQSPGIMSFPREGVNLALDFAIKGESTLKLLNTLDDIVAECGGAVYPAKDARMSAGAFRRFYPQLEEYLPFIDPHFSSDFWRRVSKD